MKLKIPLAAGLFLQAPAGCVMGPCGAVALLPPFEPLAQAINRNSEMDRGRSADFWLDKLESADAGLRRDACVALGYKAFMHYDCRPEVTFPRLARVCREDESPAVRAAAAGALSNFGPSRRQEATGLLRHAMEDPDVEVRKSAETSLWLIREYRKGM